MDAYNVVKHIGKGSFSNVYLCKKERSSFMMFSGIYNDEESRDEVFIVKMIDIDCLVKKYVKKSRPQYVAKVRPVVDTTSVGITPYTGNGFVKANDDEESHYYKRLRDLVDSEIEILKQLDDEHVIRYFSSTIQDQVYCIKMEYCHYGDLYGILKSNSNDFKLRNAFQGFGEALVSKFLKDTISGLKYIHNSNIIHRDIKLHNVLVKKEGNQFVFKISDFGFACFDLDCELNDNLDDKDFDVNSNALKRKYFKLCGTPYYMAPEIILNIEQFGQSKIKFYDTKVDLWSYGICLYELLFNMLPFSDINDIKCLTRLFTNQRVQIDMHNSIDTTRVISSSLKSLLKRLLTVDPLYRISTQEAFEYIHNPEMETQTRTINQHIDKTVSKEIVHLQESEFDSWVIETSPKALTSWDKINTTSSTLMKLSVDNTFMKWLLNKK